MGYLMGKLEGRGTDWHSHVTAITVSPEYRRLGLAKGMMDGFEQSSDLYHLPPSKADGGLDTELILWIYLYGWEIMLRLGCMNDSDIVCIDESWDTTTVEHLGV